MTSKLTGHFQSFVVDFNISRKNSKTNMVNQQSVLNQGFFHHFGTMTHTPAIGNFSTKMPKIGNFNVFLAILSNNKILQIYLNLAV